MEPLPPFAAEAFVALAEDAEGVGRGADGAEEVQGALFFELQPELSDVRGFDDFADVAVDVVEVEPFSDAHGVELFASRRAAVPRDVAVLPAVPEVAPHRLGDRPEGFDPRRVRFVEPSIDEVVVAVGMIEIGQVDQFHAELAGEIADGVMFRVDQLTAELRDLIVGKVVLQRVHPPADARRGFDHGGADAALLQAVGAGQAGRTRAEDEPRAGHSRRVPRVEKREARWRHQQPQPPRCAGTAAGSNPLPPVRARGRSAHRVVRVDRRCAERGAVA